MKDKILTVAIILFISIIIILVLDKLVDFNPFANSIKIPETFVNKINETEMNPTKQVNTLKINQDKISNKNHRNLVFTSAGDKTKFDKNWIGDNQNYDVMVVYYGKNEANYNKYDQRLIIY